MFQVLADSVAARLRELGMKAKGVQIFLRDNALTSCTRQKQLKVPVCTSVPLADAAMDLFHSYWRWQRPLRGLGLSAINLVVGSGKDTFQLSLFDNDVERMLSLEKLEQAVDRIRFRYGHDAVLKASSLLDRKLTGFRPKEDHVIHPFSYFR